jgi:hypothetical protein
MDKAEEEIGTICEEINRVYGLCVMNFELGKKPSETRFLSVAFTNEIQKIMMAEQLSGSADTASLLEYVPLAEAAGRGYSKLLAVKRLKKALSDNLTASNGYSLRFG